jgi:hypothetical protein
MQKMTITTLREELDLIRAVLEGYPDSIARRDALRAVKKINDHLVELPSSKWSEHWRTEGFNGAISESMKALSYLAENPMPSYGSQRYNSEHCHQLSSELGITLVRYSELKDY